jgi:hypothetical protein
MFSHTAAASLLAATACGELLSGASGDASVTGDASTSDAERKDARSAQDALTDVVLPDARREDAGSGRDGAMQAMDGGPDVFGDSDTELDAADAAPCDSGPIEIVDANECTELCFECVRFECHTQCGPTPPYGKAFIEDAGDP